MLNLKKAMNKNRVKIQFKYNLKKDRTIKFPGIVCFAILSFSIYSKKGNHLSKKTKQIGKPDSQLIITGQNFFSVKKYSHNLFNH